MATIIILIISFVLTMAIAFASMKEMKMVMLSDVFGISLVCCAVIALYNSRLWFMLLTPAVFIVFLAGFILLDSLKRVMAQSVRLILKKIIKEKIRIT